MQVKLEAGAETSRENLLMDKKNVMEIERDESDKETKLVNRGRSITMWGTRKLTASSPSPETEEKCPAALRPQEAKFHASRSRLP